jgi:hypothetical protein
VPSGLGDGLRVRYVVADRAAVVHHEEILSWSRLSPCDGERIVEATIDVRG